MAASGQSAKVRPTLTASAPERFDGIIPAKKADGFADGRTAGLAGRRVLRGIGGFLRPFQRVGSAIWLEVTGVFFFLPVVVFAPTLWRARASWAHGPDHRLFLLTAGIMVMFTYLSVSSFWRARKR